MAYTELKEKLEQLLAEDLSNRANLQETRRNLFLNSEGSKVQQQLLEQKQNEITSLSTLVEKKKTIVQLKEDEIAALRGQIGHLEEKILSAEINLEEERKVFAAKVAEMNGQVESAAGLQTKLNGLSLQNEEYAAKIRELIHHIDDLNSETENLKRELASATAAHAGMVQASLLEEKNRQLDAVKQELSSALEAKSLLVEPSLLDEKNLEIGSLQSELAQVKDSFAVSSRQVIDKTAEIESLRIELASLKAIPVADSKALEEKTAELERAQERADLLADSEQQLKVLVSSQNAEIESLRKLASALKKQQEEIAAGWQHQQEQLLADNSNLLAELALVKENMTQVAESPQLTAADEQITSIAAEKEQLSSALQVAIAELASLKESIGTAAPSAAQSMSDEELEGIRKEKERLTIELNATRYELDVTMQQREEKIILLQSEIASLQNQVITLSASLNRESEEKQLIGTQLEQLTSIVSEKEQQLSAMANNTANEDFIDKLMFQANRLNDEKHRLELLYTESEAELTLTRTNLATLSQLIEEQKNSISGLEETDKHVKLAQTLMLQVSDKTATKQAINELVREIDRCIALLSE
jgi:chromosome segregation ATPase